MVLQPLTEEHLGIALDIINSNPGYNCLENGNPVRTLDGIRKEFVNEETESFVLVVDDTYVGVLDLLLEHPKDQCPWLGLLMIHSQYQGRGYAKQAFQRIEGRLAQAGHKKVRIGVLETNTNARRFWTSLGFRHYAQGEWQGKTIGCFEKSLVDEKSDSVNSPCLNGNQTIGPGL